MSRVRLANLARVKVQDASVWCRGVLVELLLDSPIRVCHVQEQSAIGTRPKG